jgi:hypothetical protein
MGQAEIDVMELDPEFFYKSREMPVVAYLRLIGFQVQQVGWNGRNCWWIFDKTDGLLEAMDQYAAGAARVEPREYNRCFETTRREFFDSDPDPTPRPSRGKG